MICSPLNFITRVTRGFSIGQWDSGVINIVGNIDINVTKSNFSQIYVWIVINVKLNKSEFGG